MTSLNERKLQIEVLISNLQNELDLVNQQLAVEKFKNETPKIEVAETFNFENRENSETVRAEMIDAIIKNVSNGSNIDLDAIEKRYIDSTRDENGITAFHNFTLEQDSLVGKKWANMGHGFLKGIKFENAHLKETKKAIYLYEANGTERYLLKYI